MTIRKSCTECGNKALFRVNLRRKVSYDKRHDLCFRCSRAYLNKIRPKS